MIVVITAFMLALVCPGRSYLLVNIFLRKSRELYKEGRLTMEVSNHGMIPVYHGKGIKP